MINLLEIANAAIRETFDSAIQNTSCTLGISECKSKYGPAKCRNHCRRYMDLLSGSNTFQAAAWILYNTFNVRVGSRHAISELVKNKKLADTILNMTKSISLNDSMTTVQAYCAVLLDLQERFPLLRLPSGVMIAAESNCGGFSTVDAINFDKTYIVLNSCHDFSAYNGYSFGHKDERLKYDMIRHEVGHTIMTYSIRNAWSDILFNVYTKQGVKSFIKDMNMISAYAACEDQNQPYESFAEAFSRYTSHDYKKGDMPGWVESFIQKIITTGRSK